jgi:regulatory protein
MWRKRPAADDQQERKVDDPERSRRLTMERAVRLLAAKPRSIGELRARLLEKSWTNEEIVDGVIQRLREYGYLDDDQYARDLALSKLRVRPQGRRRLEQSLSQKQLERETVKEALDTAFEEVSEAELVKTAIEKRIRLKGKPETRDEVRKFYDHLMRRGFSYGTIREAMTEMAGRMAEDEDQ